MSDGVDSHDPTPVVLSSPAVGIRAGGDDLGLENGLSLSMLDAGCWMLGKSQFGSSKKRS